MNEKHETQQPRQHPRLKLSVWTGKDSIVHLVGQPGKGQEGRLHIHIPRGSAQERKLLTWLAAQEH